MGATNKQGPTGSKTRPFCGSFGGLIAVSVPLHRHRRVTIAVATRRLAAPPCADVEAANLFERGDNHGARLTGRLILRCKALLQLTSTRGLPNTAQVAEDIASCGLGLYPANFPSKLPAASPSHSVCFAAAPPMSSSMPSAKSADARGRVSSFSNVQSCDRIVFDAISHLIVPGTPAPFQIYTNGWRYCAMRCLDILFMERYRAVAQSNTPTIVPEE
jgi:hypothetical protein